MVDFDQEEEEDVKLQRLNNIQVELDSLAAEVYQLKRRKKSGWVKVVFIGLFSAFLGTVGGVVGGYYIPTKYQVKYQVAGIGSLDMLSGRIHTLEIIAKTKGEAAPKAKKSVEGKTTQPAAPSAEEAARAARIKALRK